MRANRNSCIRVRRSSCASDVRVRPLLTEAVWHFLDHVSKFPSIDDHEFTSRSGTRGGGTRLLVQQREHWPIFAVPRMHATRAGDVGSHGPASHPSGSGCCTAQSRQGDADTATQAIRAGSRSCLRCRSRPASICVARNPAAPPGYADRRPHPARVEAEQMALGGGAPITPVIPVPDHAIDPFAGGTVRGLAEPAFQFHSQGERGQDGRSGHRFLFGRCQEAAGPLRWTIGYAWMSSKLYIQYARQLISAACIASALRPRPTTLARG